LSRVHKRYRQTVDRRNGDSIYEREREFTFAKKLRFIYTINGDGSKTAKIIRKAMLTTLT